MMGESVCLAYPSLVRYGWTQLSGPEAMEVPAETIISTRLADDGDIHRVLTLIQSLGLNVISVERVSN